GEIDLWEHLFHRHGSAVAGARPADELLAEDKEVGSPIAQADVLAALEVHRHIDQWIRSGGARGVAAQRTERNILSDADAAVFVLSEQVCVGEPIAIQAMD